MKVKEIKGSLTGVRVKTPKGVVGYWFSQWEKGVWLKDGVSNQIYPQFVDKLSDCAEWEVTEEKVNCNKRTDYHAINNSNSEAGK